MIQNEEFLRHSRMMNNILSVGRRGYKTVDEVGRDGVTRRKPGLGGGPGDRGNNILPNVSYLHLNGYEHYRVPREHNDKATFIITETGRMRRTPHGLPEHKYLTASDGMNHVNTLTDFLVGKDSCLLHAFKACKAEQHSRPRGGLCTDKAIEVKAKQDFADLIGAIFPSRRNNNGDLRPSVGLLQVNSDATERDDDLGVYFVDSLSHMYVQAMYPLLMWRSQYSGHDAYLPSGRKNPYTLRDTTKLHLYAPFDKGLIHHLGLLKSEYILGQWARVEDSELFYRENLQRMHMGESDEMQQAYNDVGDASEAARRTIYIPANFTNSPAYWYENAMDVGALHARFDNATFFITM